MKELTYEHVFNCSVDTYWDQIFFDDECNRAMFIDGLGFSEWKVERSEDKGDAIERSVQVMPPVGDVPGAVKKVVGDNFGYQEVGTFNRKTKRYRVETKTSTMPDKFKIGGEIWLEPKGDKQSVRKARFTVDVKIFAVGKVIEGLIAGNMEKQFGDGARFINDWIAKKGL